MNINILLDPEYICEQLSSKTGAIKVAYLLMAMKHKSNIIIIQDKEQEIIRNILHKLVSIFEQTETEDFNDAQIFLIELAKGTNQYDFITNETDVKNFDKFIQKLIEKKYPLKLIISDKIINNGVKTFSIDEFGKIIRIFEEFSKKHIVSDNPKMNSEIKKIKVIDYDEYKNILFNTFWCSNEITIVAKEFYEACFNQNEIWRESNKKRYKEGFKFLFECFEEIEKFTNKNLIIKIITGIKPNHIKKFSFEGKKNVDELYNFINSFNKKFLLELMIIRWDSGDEIEIGEGHGRRVYSDYGGFETEYMPFEMHGDNPRKGGIHSKNTSFSWIDKESYLDWSKIGEIISRRPI